MRAWWLRRWPTPRDRRTDRGLRPVKARERWRARVEQAAVGVSGAVVISVDLQGRVRYFNAAAERLTGYREAELLGQLIGEVLLPRDERPAVRAMFTQLLADGSVPASHENDWLTRDGRRRRLLFVNTVLRDRHSRITHVVATGIDVTAERQAQQLSEAVLAATTQQALIAVNTEGQIILFNAGAQAILGYTPEQVLGRDVATLLHDPIELRDRAAALGVPVDSVVAAAAQAGGADTHSWTYRRSDGSTLTVTLSVTPLRSSTGQVQGYLGVAVDATAQQQREQQLQRAAEHAAHQAAHDPLTGLANRTVLVDRLRLALAALHRHQRRSGLLFLDVDRLKTVNDTHGHAAGDVLLLAVADRLTAGLRSGDLSARLGGDEFAVLLEDLHDPAELDLAAGRIAEQIQQPLRLPNGITITPTASVGATLTHPHDTPHSVLARADTAMYATKARRRSTSDDR